MPDLMAGVGHIPQAFIWLPVVVSDNHRVYGKKGMNTPHARATRARADQFTHILQAGSIPRMMGKREIAVKFFSALAVGLLLAGAVSARDGAEDEDAMRRAKQGNAGFQLYIGLLYKYYGLDFLRDAALAEDRGAAPSVVFANKAEGSRQLILSHVWLSLSEVNGNTDATLPQQRATLAEFLTPDQLEEAQSRALICLRTNYQDCD